MKKNKKVRQEGAIKRLETSLASHEANSELVKSIIEDHRQSGSEKYMKFDSNLSEDQIDKMRNKKIERTKVVLENTKNNLR